LSRFAWRTAGESHGPCLLGLVEGLPAGLPIDLARVDAELRRRQQGYGRSSRMKLEEDRIEVLGGIKQGVTIGAPVAFRIPNRDASLERLPVPGNPRPGHADLAGCQKWGHRDPRAVLERASARETAARVAAGGIARQLLEHLGVEIFAHVVAIGELALPAGLFEEAGALRHARRSASAFHCLSPGHEPLLAAEVDRAREAGDSLGGIFELRAMGLPPGLGSPASGPERLTSRLGAALFSIPAIKGVEFGLGFAAAARRGSQVHDPILLAEPGAGPRWGRFRRATNRAGGLEGGMTTGEELVCRVAMKPIPTLRQGVETVDFESGQAVRATYQRSDVTSVPAASVVGEAVVALTLVEAVLEKFGGDSLPQLERAWEGFRAELEAI
jgi:chorismate synthase